MIPLHITPYSLGMRGKSILEPLASPAGESGSSFDINPHRFRPMTRATEPGASMLFVRGISLIPAEENFSQLSQDRFSSATIRPRRCMSPYLSGVSLVRAACDRRLSTLLHARCAVSVRRESSPAVCREKPELRRHRVQLEFTSSFRISGNIKLHPTPSFPLVESIGIDAYDVARAQPFRSCFAGNILGHFKETSTTVPMHDYSGQR